MAEPVLLTFHSVLRKLWTEFSIGSSSQISIHLATLFQWRRFSRNQPIGNKKYLWWPCLITDRDEMSNLYREPSIDAFYQVSVHLAKRFKKRRLKYEMLTDDRQQKTDEGRTVMAKLTLPLAR